MFCLIKLWFVIVDLYQTLISEKVYTDWWEIWHNWVMWCVIIDTWTCEAWILIAPNRKSRRDDGLAFHIFFFITSVYHWLTGSQRGRHGPSKSNGISDGWPQCRQARSLRGSILLYRWAPVAAWTVPWQIMVVWSHRPGDLRDMGFGAFRSQSDISSCCPLRKLISS